jgi:hypothetical protein
MSQNQTENNFFPKKKNYPTLIHTSRKVNYLGTFGTFILEISEMP